VRKYHLAYMHKEIIFTKMKLAFYKHFTRIIYYASICTVCLEKRSDMCHAFLESRYKNTQIIDQFL